MAAVVGQPGGELGPAAAAIGGLEEAAVTGVAPEVADRRDIDDVRIGRVGHHPGDLAGVAQPHTRERVAAVCGLPDPIAPPHAVPIVGLSGADPDDVGVGLEEGDVTDREGGLVSKIGFQVVPALSDRKTPPEAEARKTLRKSDSTASMSTTRPPMFMGPMLRHWSPARMVLSGTWAGRSETDARLTIRIARSVRWTLVGLVTGSLRDGNFGGAHCVGKRKGVGWWLDSLPPQSIIPRAGATSHLLVPGMTAPLSTNDRFPVPFSPAGGVPS